MRKNNYLVTGATSDVGAALIDRLLAADEEATVLAQGHSSLATLAPLAERYGARLRTMNVDLADEGAVEAFLGLLGKAFDMPTHFVHLPALRVVNAKFKGFDHERFKLDMQVQVGSAAAIAKVVLPAMAKQGFGRVLFMLSSYALGAPPKFAAAYVTAKSALMGLAKSLAVEFAPKGVTVNCVAPGMMETKFLADTPDLVVQQSAADNPMGRNATPADVVPAMAFLLGDEAGFITGATLPITGGASIV